MVDLMNNTLQPKGGKYFVTGTIASSESVIPKVNENSRYNNGPQYYVIINDVGFDSPFNASLDPQIKELFEAVVKAHMRQSKPEYGNKWQLSANLNAVTQAGAKNEISFIDLKTKQEAKASFNPASGTPVTVALDMYYSQNAKPEYGHIVMKYSGLIFEDVSHVQAFGSGSQDLASVIGGITKVDSLNYAGEGLPQQDVNGFAKASQAPVAPAQSAQGQAPVQPAGQPQPQPAQGQANPFGAQGQANPFGSQGQNGQAQPQAPVQGQPAQGQANPFGAQGQANPFGSQGQNDQTGQNGQNPFSGWNPDNSNNPF